MNNRRLALIAGLGCAAIVLIGAVAAGVLLVSLVPARVSRSILETGSATRPPVEVTREVVQEVPTLTPVPSEPSAEAPPEGHEPAPIGEESLASLYTSVNPGVVNVRVYVQQGGLTGQGAGSGFVIDDEGHIVTNDHVVSQARVVTVIFHDGFEAEAEVVGTDADSDLAVLKVDSVPDSVHPLRLGESSSVSPGDWVIAIGNPFSLGGSMSLGIVSAVGRTIPTAETPFSIPQAVQTDAAINPGNSGGPLLNLEGQVVGVNAQIASGTGTNSGVGFAIPSDVVRRVAPALIEQGSYAWPWLGVRGSTVNLVIQEANGLDTQEGAYIASVEEGGPAAEAGLQGATGERSVFGQDIAVGGDVVIAADGQPILDFADLINFVAFKRPGDTVTLTILRDGSRQQISVELVERPEDLTP